MKYLLLIILFFSLSNSYFGQNSYTNGVPDNEVSNDEPENNSRRFYNNQSMGQFGYDLMINFPILDMRDNKYPDFTSHNFQYKYFFRSPGLVVPFIGANVQVGNNNSNDVELPIGDYTVYNRMFNYHALAGFSLLDSNSLFQPYISFHYGISNNYVRDIFYFSNEMGFTETIRDNLSQSQSNSYGFSVGGYFKIGDFTNLNFSATWMRGGSRIEYIEKNSFVTTDESLEENGISNPEIDYNITRSRMNMLSFKVGISFRFSSSSSSSYSSGYVSSESQAPNTVNNINNHHYYNPNSSHLWNVNRWGGNTFYQRNTYRQNRVNRGNGTGNRFINNGNNGNGRSGGKRKTIYKGKTPVGVE